jgi:peroxiredoxin
MAEGSRFAPQLILREEAYMSLNVGDAAPDFNLKAAIGDEPAEFKLSNHRGARVVILFYALDFTPV